MNKLEAIIIDLNNLNKSFKLQEEKYKSEREYYESKIKQYFGKKNKTSYDFNLSGYNYKAQIQSQKRITFDADKIEERIDKELFNEICEKTYVILDYEGMVEYLKSLGAKPKDFKKFIRCDKTINKSKVDQLGDLGDLTLDDLEGCYTVSESKSWIKINETDELNE